VLRRGRPNADDVHGTLVDAVDSEIPFDVGLSEGHRLERRKAKSCRSQTKSLAEMTGVGEDDAVRAAAGVFPHRSRDDSGHHDDRGSVAIIILVSQQTLDMGRRDAASKIDELVGRGIVVIDAPRKARDISGKDVGFDRVARTT
jgi:hypothetical protein